ncbi:MAG: hypothetical protein A3K18_14645 [Lentisphaerae bacterium RIFOXYA12_64_32]|nr:MAG: hypothetical protein A3K18_14645 [Lentisphaerae bacterium RIFOXYA12_64_32]
MGYRILSTQDSAAWRDALEAFPDADVYWLPEYHRAYEVNGDGRACAFLYADNGHRFLFPVLTRPIARVGQEPLPPTWSDFETVYGYSGPLASTNDPGFMAAAWTAFSAWCCEAGTVAGFMRFHPLRGNHVLATDDCRLVLDRETVAVRLQGSEAELWKNYPSTQRNMVRKAQAHGLIGREVPVADGLGAFLPLYHDTMTRLSAAPYYHFSPAYFEALAQGLGERLRLFAVFEGDACVAATLVLAFRDCLHYHLAGTALQARQNAAGNLLVHTVALWGLERGYAWLHLGGGRTPHPDDSLFRFKASISKERFPFYTGRRVCDPATYDSLCAQWLRQKQATERPDYFLLYRRE